MTDNTQVPATIDRNSTAMVASFQTSGGFELIQRQARVFSQSELSPQAFRGKIENCIIAIELAHRIGASPLAVMQNLHIIQGRPSFSSQFIISAINTCGSFSPLRFKIEGEGDEKTCTAYATELRSGETLQGPPVSIKMAKAEGWFGKSGSKWQTMPDLMMRYRAAAFFGRLYAPEILNGMRTDDEIIDMGAAEVVDTAPAQTATADINAGIKARASGRKRQQTAPDSAPKDAVIDVTPVSVETAEAVAPAQEQAGPIETETPGDDHLF